MATSRIRPYEQARMRFLADWDAMFNLLNDRISRFPFRTRTYRSWLEHYTKEMNSNAPLSDEVICNKLNMEIALYQQRSWFYRFFISLFGDIEIKKTIRAYYQVTLVVKDFRKNALALVEKLSAILRKDDLYKTMRTNSTANLMLANDRASFDSQLKGLKGNIARYFSGNKLKSWRKIAQDAHGAAEQFWPAIKAEVMKNTALLQMRSSTSKPTSAANTPTSTAQPSQHGTPKRTSSRTPLKTHHFTYSSYKERTGLLPAPLPLEITLPTYSR